MENFIPKSSSGKARLPKSNSWLFSIYLFTSYPFTIQNINMTYIHMHFTETTKMTADDSAVFSKLCLTIPIHLFFFSYNLVLSHISLTVSVILLHVLRIRILHPKLAYGFLLYLFKVYTVKYFVLISVIINFSAPQARIPGWLLSAFCKSALISAAGNECMKTIRRLTQS